MPKRFPEKCKPHEWAGAAAHEHRDSPGHAFQALIRALLISEIGPQVTAPGKGPDGGVDVWIDDGAVVSRRFAGPYPAIVQCKYHDPDADERATKGWNSVRNELQRLDKTGWGARARIWEKARKYIYCVSVPLSQVARENLEKMIAEDLRNLKQTVPTDVQVLSWTELRDWGNDGFASLRDAWLGYANETILPRSEYLARLLRRSEDPRRRDFRRWLHPDLLPFAKPHPDAPYHPQQIFRALQEQMSHGGVILHGPAGVGKTRTAVEVGAIAESDEHRWRVLHVHAGERGVSLLELLSEIAPSETETTLVIYDYIDQAIHFDRDEIGHALEAYGYPNAVFLCTAREAHFGDTHAFLPVELAPDELQIDRILASIRSTMGPDLITRFGDETLKEIGGRRPIIALLILDELRRRVDDDARGGDPSHIREEVNVARWLTSRLRDATKLGESPADRSSELEQMLKKRVVAGVFAAAPQTERELIEVARTTFGRAGSAYGELAEPIVKKLIERGWLVLERDDLVVAHDIVTDEMLEGVLVAHDDSIHLDVLESVLAPALTSLRTLGRMSLSFGRLIGDQLRRVDAQRNLRVAVEQWFERHAEEVSKLLSAASDEDGRDRTAYAIGAVLASSAWSAPLLARWDAVVAPWLELQRTIPETRHLLYRALRSAGTSGAMARNLTRQAIDWFQANHTRSDAGFFIVYLTHRLDLHTIETLVPKLIEWFGLHAASLDARFVIASIVVRTELPRPLRAAAYGAGERWLDAHPYDPAAFSVARALLRCGLNEAWVIPRRFVDVHYQAVIDSDATEIGSLVIVLDLERHFESTPAGWGVRALLRGITAAHKAQILAPLLRRPDLGNLRDVIVNQAMALDLRSVPAAEGAQVLQSLLARPDVQERELDAATDRALEWLQWRRRDVESGVVLEALLRRPPSDGRVYDLIRIAVRWLPLNVKRREAGPIFPLLLSLPALIPDRVRNVVSHAFDWIHAHQQTLDAQLAIEAIVRRSEDIDDRVRSRCARIALDRFVQLGHSPQSSWVGKWLLHNLNLLAEREQQRFVAAALEWAETHPDDEEREYVVNALLLRRELTNEQWLRASVVAVGILQRHRFLRAPQFLFEALSQRHVLLRSADRAYVAKRIFTAVVRPYPEVQARFNRKMISEDAVIEALVAEAPPEREFLADATAEVLDLVRLDLLRSRFVRLAALLFALTHRAEDVELAKRLINAIRNAAISDLHGRAWDDFISEYHAAVARLAPVAGADDLRAARDAALSEARHAIRIALDAGETSDDLVQQALAFAEEDLDSGAYAEAGRLLARVLHLISDSGDEERIAKATAMCGRMRARCNESEIAIFMKRCRKAMRRHDREHETDEILSLFGLLLTSYIEVKLRRMAAEARADRPLPVALIERGFAEIERKIVTNPVAAAYVLEALLVLAVSRRDDELVARCGALLDELFPRLATEAREGFRFAVYHGVESRWVVYAQRRRVLESLHLPESSDTLLNVVERHVKDRKAPVPDDMLLYVHTEIVRLIEKPNLHGAAGKLLQLLLPLSARRNGGRFSPAVRALAAFVLRTVSEEVRFNFERNVLAPLPDGHWPDVRVTVEELAALGIALPEENLVMDRVLREILTGDRPIDADILRDALRLAEERLADGNTPGAGFLLAPLLPLVARLGDDALAAKVHDSVDRLLWFGSKTARDGFRFTSNRLVAANRWPSKDQAEITLQRLGVSLRRIERLVAEKEPISNDEIGAAIQGCIRMLHSGGPEDAAGPLPAVLGAAFAHGDQTMQYRARRLLDRFLDSPETRIEQLDLFITKSRKFVEQGLWGPDGDQLIEDLGIAPVRLESLSVLSAPVEETVLETGLRAAAQLLDGPWSRRAEEYLLHLVPLSSRVETDQYQERVDSLIGRLFIKSPAVKHSFARRLKLLLEKNATPPPIAPERLARLALV